MKNLIFTSLIMSLTSISMAQKMSASLPLGEATKRLESPQSGDTNRFNIKSLDQTLDSKVAGLTQDIRSEHLSDGGVINGGGANSINDQILERYQQDTSELEVASLVTAKLQLLALDTRRFAKTLDKRAQEIKWYIVPVSIDELPSRITGIGVRTDQTAVQINKEVYVDQRLWNEMSPKQKTDLVLHELVLAEYLSLKSEPGVLFRKIKMALSMSDMRRISKLVMNYNPADVGVLGKELKDRNFGFYLTRPEKLELEKQAIALLKQYFEDCKDPKRRLLSNLTTPLGAFYQDYRAFYSARQNMLRSDLALEGERYWQKMWILQMAFIPAWYELGHLYPKELMDAEAELEGGELFDVIYPGQRGNAWDAKMGQVTCEKIKTFDYKKILFTENLRL